MGFLESSGTKRSLIPVPSPDGEECPSAVFVSGFGGGNPTKGKLPNDILFNCSDLSEANVDAMPEGSFGKAKAG
jgi:hypothetical protein